MQSAVQTYGIDKDKKFSQMFKSNHRMLGVAGMPALGVANWRHCRLTQGDKNGSNKEYKSNKYRKRNKDH